MLTLLGACLAQAVMPADGEAYVKAEFVMQAWILGLMMGAGAVLLWQSRRKGGGR